MKVPSVADDLVKVSAYLTDESFGYTHWRAAQFATPDRQKWGVMLLFDSEAERDKAFEHIKGE